MSTVPQTRFTSYGTGKRRTVDWAPNGKQSARYHQGGETVSLGGQTDRLVISSGHRAPYARFPYNGGDFYKTTQTSRKSPARLDLWQNYYGSSWWHTYGDIFPAVTPTIPAAPSTFTAMRSLMVPLGTVGWNRFRPGKPVASMAQFIGELRQLPKNPFRVISSVATAAKRYGVSSPRTYDTMRRAVGDSYLNYAFGWRPFLQDLEKLADYEHNLSRAMRQLYRDNGETIRRRGTIASDSQVTVSPKQTSASAVGYIDGPYTSGGSGWSAREVTTLVKWRCWFSAGFVYRIPLEGDSRANARLRQYLLGGGITPSTVWELTPWSWLLDYFTNIGDVLENWEASRELALAAKYAYVMMERSTTVHSAHSGGGSHGGGWNVSGASFTASTVEKARTWASAYGLGFTPGSLSNSQVANLVALGLSRRI